MVLCSSKQQYARFGATRLAFDKDKPITRSLSLDFFYELWMTQGYQLDHTLLLFILKTFFDDVLLEHDGLYHVLPIAVHLDLAEQVERVILSHLYSLAQPS